MNRIVFVLFIQNGCTKQDSRMPLQRWHIVAAPIENRQHREVCSPFDKALRRTRPRSFWRETRSSRPRPPPPPYTGPSIWSSGCCYDAVLQSRPPLPWGTAAAVVRRPSRGAGPTVWPWAVPENRAAGIPIVWRLRSTCGAYTTDVWRPTSFAGAVPTSLCWRNSLRPHRTRC